VKNSSHQRGLWGALLVVTVFGALAPLSAHARTRHSDAWAREHFATAERMREALNGRPPADRTRRNYQRVLNAYRNVYLGAPASSKADPCVVAVAEMLVEMGRRFDDDKILNEAIEQYKFLRREYPGSKYRFDGLFTIGEIYKDDLNDPAAARSTFQEFLRHYPHNRLADGARQAIVELNQQAHAEKVAKAQKPAEKARSAKEAKNNVAAKDAADAENTNATRASLANEPANEPANDSGNDPAKDPGKEQSADPRTARLARVTGIRHWSTPDYTRVAIDVENEVSFVSRRIDSPARIFFDLRDTKLASTLVGKSFDGDDGFLKKVRVAQFAPGSTRVVLEVDNLSDYDAFLLPNPYRLIIDIHGKNGRTKQEKVADESIAVQAEGTAAPKSIPDADIEKNSSEETAAFSARPVAVSDDGKISASGLTVSSRKSQSAAVVKKVVDYDDDDASSSSASLTKRRAQIAKRQASSGRAVAVKKPIDKDFETSDLGIREARPTAGGDRSLIRALGLKIGKIVIDPGHGGHDTGTIGPNGLKEKDLVLEVGRRLGKLLETRLGAEVVYTRKNDTFIPLETRTAVANQARADLFVSIHANSSHDAAARGVETYYLNFTSSPEALEVAARENAVSEKSIYELQDLVKKIALKEKIEESREFAGDVQQSLHSGLAIKSPAIRDRGVKKAPFIVLIGANMPSILAEVSFVSNPTDERRLSTSEYRQRIAESLYRGIAKYVNGLSGVKVASKMDKAAGQ
jgi:N-acetylmuramoyl-L-alanine amidase